MCFLVMNPTNIEQFKHDIFYQAIRLEHESDFLGYLVDLVRWSIANQGASVNEKTPAVLREDILNAIGRIKKLKLLLVELAQAGYTIRGGPDHPDYDFYSNYFKKTIAKARFILRKLNPYLDTRRTVSERLLLGELDPGY